MNRNLLIVGAGIYGAVAKEIAESMGCFERIDFVDDRVKVTPLGISVIGTIEDIELFSNRYCNIVVAIENVGVRLSLIRKIKESTAFRLVTLVSPYAYVSPLAQIKSGSIIEPMAVVHTGAVLGMGCIVSSGAVVGCAAVCHDGVNLDMYAAVAAGAVVPANTKVQSGTVFGKADTERCSYDSEDRAISRRRPEMRDGQEYCFEDGM